MSTMRKERKSEYRHWHLGPGHSPTTETVDMGEVELAKLREMEELKWAVQDLVEGLEGIYGDIRKELSSRRIRGRVK